MASLNDVCFERIRDTFYYGMFGEFKLVVDKKSGCFNATKLCADGGKEFYNWTRLEKSKRLMAYYENRPSDLRVYEIFQLSIKVLDTTIFESIPLNVIAEARQQLSIE
jgi:hypothetical protein